MADHKVKITADTSEKFNFIEELLKKLPRHIYEQIEHAQKGLVGLECTISRNSGGSDRKTFYLPEDTEHISAYDDYVGVHAGDYFFKILINTKEKPYVGYKLEEIGYSFKKVKS